MAPPLRPAPPAWLAGPAGLSFEGVTLSFQRYRLDRGAGPPVPPASLGALRPCPDRDGEFLVPLHPGEAVWIGLVRDGRAAPHLSAVGWHRGRARDLRTGRRAAVSRAPGQACRAVELWPGLPRPGGGFVPFGLAESADEACDRMAFRAVAEGDAGCARAAVRLVAAAEFAARTGCPAPPPADAAAAYGGWRLP